jgi:hypothetical protein
MALCSLGVDRRFRGAYCFHYQGDETSIYSETTRRYIAEGCHPHARRRENLKSLTDICFIQQTFSFS